MDRPFALGRPVRGSTTFDRWVRWRPAPERAPGGTPPGDNRTYYGYSVTSGDYLRFLAANGHTLAEVEEVVTGGRTADDAYDLPVSGRSSGHANTAVSAPTRMTRPITAARKPRTGNRRAIRSPSALPSTAVATNNGRAGQRISIGAAFPPSRTSNDSTFVTVK